MYETVLERRGRLLRAMREFLDLSACRVFTTWQQVLWAVTFAALGAAAALIFELRYRQANPAPVVVLDPVYERKAADYSVLRLRFDYRGQEAACHLVLWHQTNGFSVKC